MRSWVKYLLAALVLIAVAVPCIILIPRVISEKKEEPDTAESDISVGSVTHNYDIPEVVDDHGNMTADDVKKYISRQASFTLTG